jgi:hypothetical protein
MRAAGLLLQVLVLLLAARLATVPPMRQANQSHCIATGRILHRYCACESRIRWPQSAVLAGGNDAGDVVASSCAERGGPLARMASAVWSPAFPTAGFLIRLPSRLLC